NKRFNRAQSMAEEEKQSTANDRPIPAIPLSGAGQATDEQQLPGGKIIRSAGVVGGMTLLSRVMGMVREILYAALFGAGAVNDAFRIAYSIPYFFRRVLGEGAMAAYFLPTFVDIRENQGPEKAWRLANNVFNTLGLIALGLAGLVAVFAPQIIRVIAPGFAKMGNLGLAIDLTRIMIPFMMTMTLAAILMAILNAYHKFALPSSGTIILNLVFITGLYTIVPLFGNVPVEMIYGVGLVIVIGGFFQITALGTGVRRQGGRWKPIVNLKAPGLKMVLKLMVPALFGMAVVRVNLLIDNALASLLGEGMISSLNYAERLLQFPMGVFGVALSTAILPTLSRFAAKGKLTELRDTMNYALRMAMFVAIPASVGIMILREPLVALFFQRGAFDALATHNTSWALLFYAAGLMGYIGVAVVVPVFYAQKDTKTPVIVGSIAVAVNIVGDFALMGPLRQGGLALASAVASFVNLGLLLIVMRRRVGQIGFSRVFKSGLKLLAAAGTMGAALWVWLEVSGFTAETSTFMEKLTVGGGGIAVGAVIFILVAWALRSSELKELKGIFLGMLRRKQSPKGTNGR
ncbi:murein biosynthesis integral membrane protein MurJ, partial [bacterium]|nr:murein biosynthesis integral membrane protein MurJ [bacterium]